MTLPPSPNPLPTTEGVTQTCPAEYRIDPESFIGPTMLVGLACEAIRRDVLVGPDIDKALNGEVTAY